MDFRQRLEQSRVTLVADDTPCEEQNPFACPYFATDKSKSPACIEFRLPDGKRKALPYSYITEINYDADMGIEIFTNDKCVAIAGRNLMQLFDYLVAYRVRYVQTHQGNDFNEDGLFVKAIIIENLNP
jgi:hypothetical protein